MRNFIFFVLVLLVTVSLAGGFRYFLDSLKQKPPTATPTAIFCYGELPHTHPQAFAAVSEEDCDKGNIIYSVTKVGLKK